MGPKRRLHALVSGLVVLSFAALPTGAGAQSMSMERVDRTPNYTMVLTIGDVEQMVAPMDAMSAHSGEVMVNGPGMGMNSSSSMNAGSSMSGSSSMSSSSSMASGSNMAMNPMADNGGMANHHLEVHIMDSTGAVVSNVTPQIRIINKSTGERRTLNDVMSMYGVGRGWSDLHYGQNVWLPDGTYTVMVMVGSDTAEFRDVSVSGGGSMMSMS